MINHKIGRKQQEYVKNCSNPNLLQPAYQPPKFIKNLFVFPSTNFNEAKEQYYESRELVGQAKRANIFDVKHNMPSNIAYGNSNTILQEVDKGFALQNMDTKQLGRFSSQNPKTANERFFTHQLPEQKNNTGMSKVARNDTDEERTRRVREHDEGIAQNEIKAKEKDAKEKVAKGLQQRARANKAKKELDYLKEEKQKSNAATKIANAFRKSKLAKQEEEDLLEKAAAEKAILEHSLATKKKQILRIKSKVLRANLGKKSTNEDTFDLENMKVSKLKDIAKESGVKYISKKTKQELIEAILQTKVRKMSH